MKKRTRQSRCKNCQNLFKPDLRHLKRQKFCDKPECKTASKKHSQQKWLDKPKNRDYFSGPENVVRVQQWRQNNPGYWQRTKPPEKSSLTEDALQDTKSGKTVASKGSLMDLIQVALQDSITGKTLVFIGFDTHLSKNALQDIIDATDQKNCTINTRSSEEIDNREEEVTWVNAFLQRNCMNCEIQFQLMC